MENHTIKTNIIRSKDRYNNGSTCPYCGASTEFLDSSIVYGRSYGMIYICQPCNAYVGVHKGTDIALGRLANVELRELKKMAHRYFDPIWKYKMMQGQSKHKARTSTYQWLSRQMDLPLELTHIGMFDENQCCIAISLCRALNEELVSI